MILLRPAEGLRQLNAALHMGLKTSMTYKYLALAHSALKNDIVSALYTEAAARAAPDATFVTIHHLYMDSVPHSVFDTEHIVVANKRQQSYERHVSGKC